jgi:hypothetical protein
MTAAPDPADRAVRKPIVNGRDARDRLVCQVPGCCARISGATGFQECEKLAGHMRRAHLVPMSLFEAAELRIKWEFVPEAAP